MTGEKVFLRAVEKSDAQTLYLWENDPETWQYGTLSAPFSHYQIERYVEKANNDLFATHQLRLMIECKNTYTTIGSADLFAFDSRNSRVGVGLLLQKEFRHQGYGYDALQILMRYCFQRLSIHQMWCNIMEDNEVSIRLFQKAGFQLVGIKKDWQFRNHQWKNELLFQYINKEI
ncbi:MAG: GNAT family protein [Bacteroidales bacterium]|nr:GNAT family protein [Bacteroidales bacterium]